MPADEAGATVKGAVTSGLDMMIVMKIGNLCHSYHSGMFVSSVMKWFVHEKCQPNTFFK